MAEEPIAVAKIAQDLQDTSLNRVARQENAPEVPDDGEVHADEQHNNEQHPQDAKQSCENEPGRALLPSDASQPCSSGQVSNVFGNLQDCNVFANAGDVKFENSVILPKSEIQQNVDDETKLSTKILQFIPDKRWKSKQKRRLCKHAKVISGKRSFPIKLKNHDQPIQLVPVALSKMESKTLDQLDKEGHYSKRDDFQQLLSPDSEVFDINEAFSKAYKQAESEAKSQGSKEAAEDYVDRYGNSIAFIGQAGIGKTTLTRMIVEMIQQGKLFPQCKYIFCVFCREIDFKTKTTFLQMCFTGTDIKIRHKQTTEKSFMKAIGDGEKVVFVCDGLDEANTDAFYKDEPLPSSKVATADVHLKKLITAKIWKKSKKVVTCRPRQFWKIAANVRPTSVFTLKGISPASQRNLSQQICETAEEVTQVMSYLHGKRDIGVLCYVPVLCIIIIFVIHRHFSEGKELEIESLTFIFFKVLQYFCQSEHIREAHPPLSKLALLAWNGFKNTKNIFTSQDFLDVGMDQNEADAFLLYFVDTTCNVKIAILEGFTRSSFTHLLWLENLSALHLAFLSSLDEFITCLPQLSESQWEVVSRFLFGFFNEALFSTVSRFLTAIGCNHDLQLCEAKKAKLVEFAVQFMQEISSNDTQKLLIISAWLNEIRNSDLGRTIGMHVPSEIKLQGDILPSDVPSLIYLLSLKPVSLDISRNRDPHIKGESIDKGVKCFQGNGFVYFIESLKLQQFKISLLDLSFNKIGDKGAMFIVDILQNLNNLILAGCDLTDKGVNSIAKELLNSKISLLDFSYNQIGDDGAMILAGSLQNLDSLILSGCGITTTGVGFIVAQFEHMKLSLLNLADNFISKSGIDALSKHSYNIDLLVLSSYAISENEICKHNDVVITNVETDWMEKIIVNKSQSRTFTIGQYVVIGSKQPTADVLSVLSLCLQHFDEINLQSSELTTADLQELAYSVSHLQNPILTLDLSNNQIEDSGALLASTLLHNLVSLVLHDCGITAIGAQSIAAQISQYKAISLLDLSYNEIGDDGAMILAGSLQNLDILVLSGCGITSFGVGFIVKQSEDAKLSLLNLADNFISKSGIDALSKHSYNIDQLVLSSYAISENEICKHNDVVITNVETDWMEKIIVNKSQSRTFTIGQYVVIGSKQPTADVLSVLSLCLQHFNEINLQSSELTTADLQELAYVITYLKKPISLLNLGDIIIGKSGIDALSNCLQNIEQLVLPSYVIGGDGIISQHDNIVFTNGETSLIEQLIVKHETGTSLSKYLINVVIQSLCLKHLNTIYIAEPNFTLAGLQELAYAVPQLNQPLKTLHISKVEIDIETLKYLSKMTPNIYELELQGCAISNLSEFVKFIDKRCRIKLNMSQSKIGNDGVVHLSKIADQFDELNVSYCGITEIGQFTNTMERNQSKIKILDLSGNKIGYEGIGHLSNIIHNIDELKLNYCEITDISQLTAAIERKQCKVERLDLQGSYGINKQLDSILSALKNIKHLFVPYCGFTILDKIRVRSKLRQLGLSLHNGAYNSISLLTET